jgi:FkbM family methyltransferase
MNKNNFYKSLINLNINPQVIVDCGAARGEWSSMIKSIFPESFVLGVDANDWCKGNIPGADAQEIQVLSDVDDKELTFYRKKENIEAGTFCTGDSLYREASQHYQSFNTIEETVKTKTLNYILNKHNKNKIDILKIDTQGSELLIMKGLGEKLNEIKFIELEVSILEYNEGGCSFNEIIAFLSDNFNVYDIVDITRSNLSTFNVLKTPKGGDFLFQMDVIFKNKSVIF